MVRVDIVPDHTLSSPCSTLSQSFLLRPHLKPIWSEQKKPVGCLKRVTGIHGTANLEYGATLSLMMSIQIQIPVIRTKRMLIGLLRRRWTLFGFVFCASLNLHAIFRSYVFPSLLAHWEHFPCTRGNLVHSKSGPSEMMISGWIGVFRWWSVIRIFRSCKILLGVQKAARDK